MVIINFDLLNSFFLCFWCLVWVKFWISGRVKSVFFVFIVWWKFLRGIHAIPVNLIVVMLWVNVLLLHFMNFISLLQSFFGRFFYELNKYSFQTDLSCYFYLRSWKRQRKVLPLAFGSWVLEGLLVQLYAVVIYKAWPVTSVWLMTMWWHTDAWSSGDSGPWSMKQ